MTNPTPLTDVDTELAKILNRLHADGCPASYFRLKGEPELACDCGVTEAHAAIKALIGTIAEQIIGKDEDFDRSEYIKRGLNGLANQSLGKDILRAEQRQRLKDYMENKSNE